SDQNNMKFLLIYVPNLRFSFEEDWCTSTIGENFRLSSGLTPSTKEKAYFNNGIIPWINSGELKNKYISFTENKLTLDAVKKHNLTIYPMDTMVIAIYGLEAAGVRGKASITKMDSTISQSCMAFNSLGNVLTQFMYYVYKKEAQILGTRYAQGTKQQNLSSDLLSSYKLLYPSKEEQLKIVNFLSLIDEKIETQSKIINDLVLQKKCIISSLLKSVQDNEKIMLKDILFDYNIKTTINNEYPVLSSTASGMYLQSEYFNKEASSDNTIGYKIIPRGYCTYRSMSDTGLFTFNMQELVEKGIVSPAYPVFSANDDYINEFIILYLNNSSYIKKQILELKSGGTRFALPFSTLCTLKIPKLDKEKQLSLIKTITAFERKIENEEMLLKALHQQKNFLLNNMFI
ncbi:MAG: restriction endonuclease subunit S, partial [Clostridia bacterium]